MGMSVRLEADTTCLNALRPPVGIIAHHRTLPSSLPAGYNDVQCRDSVRGMCCQEWLMGREYPSAPVVGVGAVVIKDTQVLLVRRANDPNRDQWSIPGGIVALGETLAQAAVREVREECKVEIEPGDVLTSADLIQRDRSGRIRYHYVLIDLAARYLSGEPVAGTDASEARWIGAAQFDELDIIPRLLPVLRQALRRQGI
jgi:ADP-ribose pyrophosphatase